MLLPRFVFFCSLPVLLATPACEGKSSAPPPAANGDAAVSAAAPAPAAKAVESPSDPVADGADAGPTPAEIAAVEAKAPTQGPVPSLQDDPEKALGAHLADPRWFRKTIFGNDAKVLDTKRSKADDQGRFSSLIRFELPNMNPEACADHLQGVVKEDLPAVERETQPDGRVQLSGSNERYKITFICGEAEGKTVAYVSYQWT